MKKVVILSDFNLKGSGYLNIAAPLAQELSKNHKVWAAGLGYEGEEHPWDFSLVPCKDFQEVGALIQNLQNEHAFDVIIVALDIPLQEKILKLLKGRPFKYIGIFPLEADPCIIDTAMVLMQMDKTFCISQFGTNEINKLGVGAEHLIVGMDTEAWRRRDTLTYEELRGRLGYTEDDFIIFSVADNQERKNLSASMEIVARLKERGVPVKFNLVTRPELSVGWKLQTYANELGIQNDYMEIPRGIAFQDLWMYYAMSDVFLSTTKAEGLSMPVLEAMAVGVPVVAPGHTALSEHLADGKGYPLDSEYKHRDPFLNGWRYWVDKKHAEEVLWDMWEKRGKLDLVNTDLAREYVENRNWGDAALQVENFLETLE